MKQTIRHENLQIEFSELGGGYLVNTGSVAPDGTYIPGRPRIYPRTIALTPEGQAFQVDPIAHIEACLSELHYTDGANAKFVSDWKARQVRTTLQRMEIAEVEILPDSAAPLGYTTRMHQGQKAVTAEQVRVVTLLSDGRIVKLSPPPKWSESQFSRWLGQRIEEIAQWCPIDPRSVTKKDVGETYHLAYRGERAGLSQKLHAGLACCVPAPRHSRELSGLKHAERIFGHLKDLPLLRSEDPNCNPPQELWPYLADIRVGIAPLGLDLVDTMIGCPSLARKMGARLTRRRQFPVETPGCTPRRKLSRSQAQYVWERLDVYDESSSPAGPMKLILPGGLKGVADIQSEQLYDEHGEIDLLVDPISVARKGGLAILAMLVDEITTVPYVSLKEAEAFLNERLSLLKERAFGTKDQPRRYQGWSGSLLCYRAGERHTEHARIKPTPVDAWYFGLKGETPKPTRRQSEEYLRWGGLFRTLAHTILQLGGTLEQKGKEEEEGLIEFEDEMYFLDEEDYA